MVNETSNLVEKARDWPHANYFAEAFVAPTKSNYLRWKIEHELYGASGIEELIAQKKAAWAVEYRCAETMIIGTEISAEHKVDEGARKTADESQPRRLTGSVSIDVETSDVGGGTVHIWPGVITTQRCVLNTSGSEWGEGEIEIGGERWLVRGEPQKLHHEQNSILVFRASEAMEEDEATIFWTAVGMTCGSSSLLIQTG